MEAALSIYLESFAKTLGSREQLAIAEFADALLVIPKTLAVNAGKVQDANISISQPCYAWSISALWQCLSATISLASKHALLLWQQHITDALPPPNKGLQDCSAGAPVARLSAVVVLPQDAS